VRLYVVDASVAAKWYFPEESSDRAATLLERAGAGAVGLIAPDLLLYEMGSVALKKMRTHQAKLDDAEAMLSALAAFRVQLVPSASFVPLALGLAAASGASFYDAVYLVTARESGGTLVTNDRRLVAQARGCGMAGHVITLAELPF
jgi:predicted nucleic acid-binding protein